MKYTVRIELLEATDADHLALSKQLLAEGFERSVSANDGTRYELPEGEYNYDARATANDVLDTAKRAAGRVGRPFRVLVTEVAGRVWFNLGPG